MFNSRSLSKVHYVIELNNDKIQLKIFLRHQHTPSLTLYTEQEKKAVSLFLLC